MMSSTKNVKVLIPKPNQQYAQPTIYYTNGSPLQQTISKQNIDDSDSNYIQGMKVLNNSSPCTTAATMKTPQIITQSQYIEIQKAYHQNMKIQSPMKHKLIQPIPISTATPLLHATNIDIKPEIISIPYDSQILEYSSLPKSVIFPTVLKTRKRASDAALEPDVLSKVPRVRAVKGKGLRHFSMKVCQKVQQKGVTSYNEVADELVQEFLQIRNNDKNSDPNIRRRVYDALNVLMAMNIISKQKKEIRWVGLPTNTASELTTLTTERDGIKMRIEEKRNHIKELILQQIAFKNLIARNVDNEQELGYPGFNLLIHLPFVVVNTNVNTVIDCSISQDKYEYMFNFNKSFEITDDIDIMKRMGLVNGLDIGNVSFEDLQSSLNLVPDNLKKYVLELANTQDKKKGYPSPLGSQISDTDDPDDFPAAVKADLHLHRQSTSNHIRVKVKIEPDDSNSCMSSSIEYE